MCRINYRRIRPLPCAGPRGFDTARATTTVDRLGSTTIALSVRVSDDSGRLIAVGNIGYTITYRTP